MNVAKVFTPPPAPPLKVAPTPALELLRLRAARKKLIDPRTSSFATVWDSVSTVAIFFVALVTPFEVCFLDPPLSFGDPLFVINRLVDCVFIADCYINFFLIYSTFDPHRGRIWVEDHQTIVRHYLFGWFSIDVVSTLVSGFDIVALALDQQVQSAATSAAGGGGATAAGSDVDGLQSLKMVKLVRGLRLVKLLRLLRGSRIFRRFETKMSIRYSTLDIVKCFMLVITAAHWSACAWGLIAAPLFVEEPLDTWLGKLEYCRHASDVQADADALLSGDPLRSKDVDGFAEEGTFSPLLVWSEARGAALCVDKGRVYLAALYWAFLLVTNTGYSDMFFRSVTTTTEQVVSIVIIVIAQSVWAHVLATFTGILIQSNPHTREFRHNMDQLNRFLKEQPDSVLSQSTRQRLREYMHQSRHIMIDAANKRLIESMSPALQGEVAYKTNRVWLERVLFLRPAEPAFMVALALELTPMVFAPGEEPMAGFLYIVHRGLALHAGKVISAGKVWGEDMILSSAELRSSSCAKAMNYLEVHMIGREELLDLAVLYPRTYRMLRRQIAFLALRRFIIARARAELSLGEAELLCELGEEEMQQARSRSATRAPTRKRGALKLESALSAATEKSAVEHAEDVYRQQVIAGQVGVPPPPLLSSNSFTYKQPPVASGATGNPNSDGAGATAAASAAGGEAALPCGAPGLSTVLQHLTAQSSGATRDNGGTAKPAPGASGAMNPAGSNGTAAAGNHGNGHNGHHGISVPHGDESVLRALVRTVEALRGEVGQLRAEQMAQREAITTGLRQRTRLNRAGHAGSAAAISGGTGAPSASRSGHAARPEQRLARRRSTPAAASAVGSTPSTAAPEHFEA